MSELRCTVCGYAWPDSDIPDRAIPRLDAHCPICGQTRTFTPPTVSPGDRVTYDGQDWVVVDTSGDGAAILRRPDDEAGEHLVAVEAVDLGGAA